MNDRVILIDKPPGMTSFGVVARVRRVLSHRAGKKVKVGVMTAENAETFINAMNLENPESRRLDSMKTDNRYQEFELYYGDTNSAYIDFIKGYKDYVHVVIKILKRRGCKFRGVVTRSLEIANRLNHAEYYKIKKKNRIAKSLSNIGLGISTQIGRASCRERV